MYHPTTGGWYQADPAPDGCVTVSNFERALDCQRLGGQILPDGGLQWTPGALDQLRLERRQFIDVQRDRALEDGLVSYNGHQFQVDPRSVSLLTSASALAQSGVPLPAGFAWRSDANENVPFTVTDIIALGAMAMQFTNSVFARSWERKAAVDAAITAEEVLGVDW